MTTREPDPRGRRREGGRGRLADRLRDGRAAPLALLVALLGTLLVPAPRTAASPSPVGMDLYRAGDFVSQTNLVQCVGASMQMMRNMILSVDDRTAATQHRLFELAVALGDPSAPYADGAHGASALGWAAGLTETGLGTYRVVPAATLPGALELAARAIESTGRPVGLLVWQGAHAWVMSGFDATSDPLLDPGATISAVRVLDPLYPRPGGSWGPTQRPDARLTPAQLATVFVPYRPHSRTVALRNRYVLVLPIERGRHNPVTRPWPY